MDGIPATWGSVEPRLFIFGMIEKWTNSPRLAFYASETGGSNPSHTSVVELTGKDEDMRITTSKMH